MDSHLHNQSIDYKLKTQEEVVKESFNYIKDRMNGNFTRLKTFSERLDKMVGYFEPNTILTISALSGGGKSTLSKRIINSILANLKAEGKESAVGLSFNFEMLAHKTVGREIVNLSKIDLRTIYSVEESLSPAIFTKLYNQYSKDLQDLPMFYVEEPENYQDIKNIIFNVWEQKCKPTNKILIVEIDHAMITKGIGNDNAKDRLDKLMENLNVIKKRISAAGGKIFMIVLSQMNRDIKDINRRLQPDLHYPITSDLFQSSNMEFYSDYILISHMPATLNLKEYGPEKLPCYVEKTTGTNKVYIPMIYFHLLKNRDGQSGQVLPFISNLRFFDFTDITREDFQKLNNHFKQQKTIPNLDLLNGKA